MFLTFTQVIDPTGNLFLTTLVALIPVALLLTLLAIFRVTAWLAVIIGSVVTLLLGILLWGAPADSTFKAYILGSATGIWSVDWITFWGVVIFNTLVFTGLFDKFKQWLIVQATGDVRVQAILLAWALGALLEGLVGFGYPWAVVAPILIAFGIVELDAIRVAAIANNAPVSYGALGAPIIGLAAVTGLPLLALSASVGKMVAVLALLPPWVLIYLVSGWKGIRGGWPLAVVGSLAYIAGQFPISQWVGPYLPDVVGSLVCFAALLVLLRFWRPSETLGYGGVVVKPVRPATPSGGSTPQIASRDVWLGLAPFIILVVVVALWTGPWSPLPKYIPYKAAATFISSISHKPGSVVFAWAPGVAGTSILASWLLILVLASIAVRPRWAEVLPAIFAKTFQQMWGALLVGVFIFGLANVFNFSGMANSMAKGFASIGPAYILIAAVLGWIGVALSGSNTSTNALFGAFQKTVGQLLGFPILLLPTLNSVGAEVGKPIAPQTTSVGVSTTSYVRREGEVIRHNLGWTLVLLGYLIVVGLFFYFVLPGTMKM
ncbi:MAG: L-lactate permease [Candidatus Dormibacteraceae bacterium]